MSEVVPLKVVTMTNKLEVALMKALSTFFFLLFIGVSAEASTNGMPFKGANCNLTKPPASSGEDGTHGHTIKVYPRLRSIGRNYKGCVITWGETQVGYEILGITFVEAGSAVAFWSPTEGRRCDYQSGDSSDTQCPDYSSLIPKSMAPGCVKRLLNTGKSVPGCRYE